jgi:hypothetical protein
MDRNDETALIREWFTVICGKWHRGELNYLGTLYYFKEERCRAL